MSGDRQSLDGPPAVGGAGRVGAGPLPFGPQGELRPIGFGDVVRSEWTKVRSVMSTTVTMLVTVVLVVGLGGLICLAIAHSKNPSISDPTQASLVMLVLAQLAVGIFGVMSVTSEYASGTIRPSLMAVPRRTTFFLGKLTVVAVICLVVGEVVSFSAFGVGQAILDGHTASASLGQPGVLRAVIGAGLYLTALGVVGVGFGLLVRVTAGGIAIVVVLVFIAPIILAFIPGHFGNDLQRYWPTEAGSQIYRVESDSTNMAPWPGFAVLVGFVAVVLVGAAAVLNRRDA